MPDKKPRPGHKPPKPPPKDLWGALQRNEIFRASHVARELVFETSYWNGWEKGGHVTLVRIDGHTYVWPEDVEYARRTVEKNRKYIRDFGRKKATP